MVTNSVPSRANTRREPQWLPPPTLGVWRQITSTLDSAASFSVPARDRGAGAAVARLGEAQVHEAVLGERRRQRDAEQAALAAGAHARHAAHRPPRLAVLLDEQQLSRALGDEHAAVGQEREPPRVIESARDLDDGERSVDGRRRRRLRRLRPPP